MHAQIRNDAARIRKSSASWPALPLLKPGYISGTSLPGRRLSGVRHHRRHREARTAQARFEFSRRQRPAEQIPLYFIATVMAQIVELFLRFDALGNHLQFQIVAERNDRYGDCRIVEIDRD